MYREVTSAPRKKEMIPNDYRSDQSRSENRAATTQALAPVGQLARAARTRPATEDAAPGLAAAPPQRRSGSPRQPEHFPAVAKGAFGSHHAPGGLGSYR